MAPTDGSIEGWAGWVVWCWKQPELHRKAAENDPKAGARGVPEVAMEGPMEGSMRAQRRHVSSTRAAF
jgi:hypothetical protein